VNRANHCHSIGLAVVGFAVALGCSDSSDPFDKGMDNQNAGDGGLTTDGGGTTTNGGDVCETTRLVVLGDSIVACAGRGNGGIDSPTCSPKMLHEYMNTTYVKGITYENVSDPGAVTDDVPTLQIPQLEGGPGHLLVVVYVGGNDLSPYIYKSDAEAEAGFEQKKPEMVASWEKAYAMLNDASKFPGGVTIIINNQYNLFDDCSKGTFALSPTKIGLFHKYNDEVAKRVVGKTNVILADQFTPFLGHGLNYSNAECPYYKQGNENWMADFLHPNVPGHAQLFSLWQGITDGLYKSCK
jgi:hypothetical protein